MNGEQIKTKKVYKKKNARKIRRKNSWKYMTGLDRTITESRLPQIPAPPRTIVTTELTRAN